MAVMRNSIIFGGVDSADYGIYIGGEGTFNAPKRDVEMISIPGRNGAFALDKGRFENIEVTYSAFNYETDLATFAQNLSDFRNAICSQKGYQRLTDTFHTDEYRMAAYISGLEIKPIDYNTASKFDIVFDCKPQRYLMSGESAIDVSSGGTVLNPTLFEARPMLEVEGYGEITIGDETITLNNATLGDVIIAPTASTTTRTEMTVSLDVSNINSGDTITINKVSIQTHYYLKVGYTCNCTVASTSNVNVTTSLNGRVRNYVMENVTLQYRQTETKTGTATINNEYAQNGGSASTIVTTEGIEIDYQPPWKSIKVSLVLDNVFVPCFDYQALKYSLSTSEIHANSSKSALGDPTYIDLDIGEAYLVNAGVPVSLNNTATFPAELPTLKSGSNSVTFDNTITDLKIIPRWWKV